MKKSYRNWITWYLVMAMFVMGITPRVYGGFSPSEVIGLSPAERSSDLIKIQKFLEMKMIRERLNAFGFSQEEIQTRLNQLTDDQIHQMVLKLDEMKVGADAGEAIIIFLLILILVALIIYITGHKIIVK